MRSLFLALVVSLAAGCAADADTCALNPSATYTVSVVPDGRPQVGTLGGLFGECDLSADKQWAATCTGERLTYTCGDSTLTYTVLAADETGYTVELANPAAPRAEAETLHVVEGGISE